MHVPFTDHRHRQNNHTIHSAFNIFYEHHLSIYYRTHFPPLNKSSLGRREATQCRNTHQIIHSRSPPTPEPPPLSHEPSLLCFARQELGNKNITALPHSTCSITLTFHIQHHTHTHTLTHSPHLLCLTLSNAAHSPISLQHFNVSRLFVRDAI